jgi:soluble lytic murein transglycosylase-like protein
VVPAAGLPELREPPPATLADVRNVPAQLRKQYAQMISKVAKEQKMDAALIHAVVSAESFYNAQAVSPKGATGLMQLMPDTAKRYGITDLLNPLQNLRAGAKYLRDLLAKFGHDKELAIAAYNAGEGAVMRSGNKIPNYPETRAYVPKVLEYYERYRGSRI